MDLIFSRFLTNCITELEASGPQNAMEGLLDTLQWMEGLEESGLKDVFEVLFQEQEK